MILFIILYLIVLAILHALWELQIEGNYDGWARNLPCWRWNKIWKIILGGKPMTGYHWYMLLMFTFLFHSPFLFIPWTIPTECLILGIYIYYWLLEDFLWFILNPLYTLKKFRKGSIEWHKRWILGLPLSYWVGLLIGTILIYLGRIR